MNKEKDKCLVREVVSVCYWARRFKIQKTPQTAKKRTNNTKKSGDWMMKESGGRRRMRSKKLGEVDEEIISVGETTSPVLDK